MVNQNASNRRITLVSDISPPYFGGMENHAFEFSKYFSKNGDRLSKFFLMFPSGGSLTDASKLQPSLKGNKKVDVLGKNTIHDSSDLISKVKASELDDGIIFFNSMYWIRVFGDLKKSLPKTNLIMRSGGNDILQAALEDKGSNIFQRQSYIVNQINKYLDLLIVNSKYSFDRFSQLGI